eukprot:CAMPEP_0198197842 /NCGR_PEP_ID=MMETSP1445-20131203/1409_1 /TAXON_ID=36898 /ORGANISM="Pyramimonas sp., Strain CCMP2087" /LENGTH=136 /DNA_ID=CAMNT_0043867243 /DNA_START=83 /DNA_END=490 /DNA_ORIENTATION=-
MVRKQPCHMPCNQEDKGHSLPVNANVSSFKPVTIEVARAMIEELNLRNPVEPFQHPDYGLCYATDMHVLTHAPAALPENASDPVKVCRAAYCRHTTHAPLHNTEARKDRDAQQKKQEAEAAGDEEDSAEEGTRLTL